tara:strand:- start:43 stop:258 length:216 start_codon:yes stop_codon:yes gene_type:complete
MSNLYINPLGEVKNVDFTNNLKKIRDNKIILDASLKSKKHKNKSNKLQLMIWSIVLAIIILIFLILLRNIK